MMTNKKLRHYIILFSAALMTSGIIGKCIATDIKDLNMDTVKIING
ncbi:MAG: hypothetical protein ACI9ST_000045 [Psychrobacter glaciei]|jgi:hypothetical protein